MLSALTGSDPIRNLVLGSEKPARHTKDSYPRLDSYNDGVMSEREFERRFGPHVIYLLMVANIWTSSCFSQISLLQAKCPVHPRYVTI